MHVNPTGVLCGPFIHAGNCGKRWEEAAKLANDAFGGSGGISGVPNQVDPYSPAGNLYIDGNLGGTAAVLEMLLQSYHGELHFLPALPSCWPTGRASGLRACGGFAVTLASEAGRLTGASVTSTVGGRCTIRNADPVWRVTGADGCTVDARRTVDGRLVFDTVPGASYAI